MPAPKTKPLKVMISSTSLDLPEHRKKVMDAILRAGCQPLAIEHGSATSDSDALRFSREMVDQADVYVGVFALRYGFVPANEQENPEGWSVTEHEYRRAVERGIPRLIYLADEEHRFTQKDIDFDPLKRARLQALKEELRREEICGFFSSPETLHSLVIQSLFQEKEKQGPATPAELSAPAPIPHPPELYAVPPYTLTDRFVGRRAELAELDAWASSPDPVMVVESIGGMGKSALTWEWVRERAGSRISGLAGTVWWSFYERGTSMKTFLRHALAYVTQQNPESLQRLDTYACGLQLLAELGGRPYLLVLDGFERVLTAYHRIDKAQVPDDQVPADKRELTNPRDGDVLRQLVHCDPSKILVSTRLMPKALEDRHTHRPIPGVRHLELEGLAPGDALDMVQHAGIRGDAGAILGFADHFGRHALLLRIVCGMVTDYRQRPGDFDAWRADPYAGGGLKLSELPLKQRYTHILEYAFRGLGEKARQLLSRIAVLSDGADYATIAVLNPFLPPRPEEVPEPDDPFESLEWIRFQRRLNTAVSPEERDAIEAEKAAYREKHEPEYREQKQAHERYEQELRAYLPSAEYHQALADFHTALGDLEDRGLLQWDRDTNTYDLHPVVRAYAFEQLEERDRTRAYDAIHDHFASLPPENVEQATELAHVKNSIEIMRALIGASRFEEALSFYRGSLSDRLLFSIGAYHVAIELMSQLLGCDKAGTPVLADLAGQSYAMNAQAIALFLLSRSQDAVSLGWKAISIDISVERWDNLATSLWNLSSYFDAMNRLAASGSIAELAYELAAAVGNEDGVAVSFLDRMSTATTLGEFDKAEGLFNLFRQSHQPPRLIRPGSAEFRLARLRFFQGKLTATDLVDAEQIAAQGGNLDAQHGLAALQAEWELTRCNRQTLWMRANMRSPSFVEPVRRPRSTWAFAHTRWPSSGTAPRHAKPWPRPKRYGVARLPSSHCSPPRPGSPSVTTLKPVLSPCELTSSPGRMGRRTSIITI